MPAELQRIVRKALTKDTDMRFSIGWRSLDDLKNSRRDLDIQGEIERSIVPNREALASDKRERMLFAKTGTHLAPNFSVGTLLHKKSFVNPTATMVMGPQSITPLPRQCPT